MGTARKRDAAGHPCDQVLQLGDSVQGARRERTRRRAGHPQAIDDPAVSSGVSAHHHTGPCYRHHARPLQVGYSGRCSCCQGSVFSIVLSCFSCVGLVLVSFWIWFVLFVSGGFWSVWFL